MPTPAFPVALLVGVLLAAGIPVAVAADSVTADHGVAAGGDIRNSTITIGITPEQLELLILDSAKHAKQAEELSSQLGVTKEALDSFFQIFQKQKVPLEKLPDTLATIAQRFREMQERLAALNPDDPDTKVLIEKARKELNAGHYNLADALLQQAEAAEQAAARQAEQLAHDAQAAADRRWLNAAAARAVRGESSLTRLNYRDAAAHFRAATDMTPASALTTRGQYRRRWADALSDYGDQQGDNAALEQAIALYRQALTDLPRAQQPQEWALTQNNLGLALETLGGQEAGTARLEEAVAAYRAALAERTRARAPLDWAMTQNNLGLALETLGERETGTARLEKAVAAYRAALEELTRERAPLGWATIQANLGLALERLGARETGTARLEEAVAILQSALEEITRARAPLDWATTQTNLGNALRALGAREAGTARLEEAVAVLRAALEERTRARVPLDWAMTQASLGNALQTLGERETGTTRLEEAVTAYRAALEEYTRTLRPLGWAATQANLGLALERLGARERGTARLEEAVAVLRAALEELTRERVPRDWAQTQLNLAKTYRVLKEETKADAICQELREANLGYQCD